MGTFLAHVRTFGLQCGVTIEIRIQICFEYRTKNGIEKQGSDIY